MASLFSQICDLMLTGCCRFSLTCIYPVSTLDFSSLDVSALMSQLTILMSHQS